MAIDNVEAVRKACIEAIAEHLATVGSAQWKAVRERFPEVDERTFFRWVKAVKEGTPDKSTLAADVRNAKVIAQTHANLPVAPPPSYLGREGAKAFKRVNLWESVHQAHADIERLRAYSMKPDPDDPEGVTIKNPVFFDVSIKRRLEAIEKILRLQNEIWELERIEAFHKAICEIIVEEIGPMNAPVQERILHRLKALNEAYAMNADGLHASTPSV